MNTTSISASMAADESSLGPTYGAYLLSTFVALILYGISIHQTYRYYRLFPADGPFIRTIVITVMVLETAHTAMTMHTCYYYLVTHFFQPSVLQKATWSLSYAPILIGLVDFITQLFFARRVFLIGPRYRAAVIISMGFYLMQLGISGGAIWKGIHISSINDLSGVTYLVAASFGAAVVGDTILGGVLFHVIKYSRRGLTRHESLLESVSLYVINTGLLHSVLNLVALIVALAWPTFLIHSGINVITTRIYAIVLLAVLNSRQLNMSRGLEVFEGMPAGLHIISRANRLVAQEQWNVPQIPDPSDPAVINIKVTTEMEGDGALERHGKETAPSVDTM